MEGVRENLGEVKSPIDRRGLIVVRFREEMRGGDGNRETRDKFNATTIRITN